jgi:hypothetical protein
MYEADFSEIAGPLVPSLALNYQEHFDLPLKPCVALI